MKYNNKIRQRLFEMDKNTVLSLLFDRTDKNNHKLIKATYLSKDEVERNHSNGVIISWNCITISAKNNDEQAKTSKEREHYFNEYEDLMENEKLSSNPYKEYELDWKMYWVVDNTRLYYQNKVFQTFMKNAQIWMDTAFNQITWNKVYNEVILEHWYVWDCARQDLESLDIWIKDVSVWDYEDEWYDLPTYTVLLSKNDIVDDKSDEELYNLIRQRLFKAYNRIFSIIEHKYKQLDLPVWPWWYAKLSKEEESFVNQYIWLNEIVIDNTYDASKFWI